MSSVRAITSDLIFKVRMASFSPMNQDQTNELLKQFSDFIKQKSFENNFLVWSTKIEILSDQIPGRFYEVEK